MTPINISKSIARRIVLDAQLLNGSAGVKPGKAGTQRIIDQLGYIQIDTIHIVERAHHHTLRTRQSGYTPVILHDLQAVDRTVFEYWAHAMAYLPMPDYRFMLYRMKQFRSSDHPWLQYHTADGGLPLGEVLKRIRAEGALTAKDFQKPSDRKRGPWWDWGPAKSALELLFWRGELMISERRNFQKVYDLTERVLPPGTDTRMPDERETAVHLIRQALSALGIASLREICVFKQPASGRDSKFRAVPWEVMIRTVEELAEEKVLVEAVIRGGNEERCFLLRDALDGLAGPPRAGKSVHILSPFDNLIIQRDRTGRLFDFSYTLECYLPASKRTHGYFVLPVLYGDSFAGRIDPQADRKSGRLILHSVSLEKDFKPSGAFIAKFAGAIADFAAFNQCDSVVIEKTKPAKLKSVLKSNLAHG
jgi:uncharacterized protein